MVDRCSNLSILTRHETCWPRNVARGRKEQRRGTLATQKFLTEASMVAKLDHPNIVPMYDVGRTEAGNLYIVSKFIEGVDLDALAKPRVYIPQDQHTWAKPPTWTYYSHDIGPGSANSWGLHDMHGNVAECMLSTCRSYPYRDDDGRNSATPQGRKVVRGGSFCDRPQRRRSAFRLHYPACGKRCSMSDFAWWHCGRIAWWTPRSP